MIFSEEHTYGWGSGGIPMPREVAGKDRPRRHPVGGHRLRDLPWGALLSSLLLTMTGLLALLLLDRHLPPALPRGELAPVKIAMRLPEEAPAVEPPQAQPAKRQAEKARTPERPARPQPVPVAPPPPIPKAPAAIVTLPRPEPPPPAAVKVDPPSPAGHERREPPVAPLPRRQAAVQLGREEATLLGPGPGPDLRPRAGRPAAEALPGAASVALSGRPGLDLATTDSGGSRPHYREDRREAGMPIAEHRQALSVAGRDINPGAAPALDPHRFQRPAGVTAALPVPRTAASFDAPAAAEVNPPPAAAAARTGAPASSSLPTGGGASFDFLDRVAAADLDRMHLVSLNRLRTCVDPGAEMKLRTRLASLLSRPGTCRAGGVVFDIRQPESAWSIHVDIYNYEKREFPDRCAALRLAVSGCEGGRR